MIALMMPPLVKGSLTVGILGLICTFLTDFFPDLEEAFLAAIVYSSLKSK
jgi:hypothetical protein